MLGDSQPLRVLSHELRATMLSLTEPATSQGLRLMELDTETLPVDSTH